MKARIYKRTGIESVRSGLEESRRRRILADQEAKTAERNRLRTTELKRREKEKPAPNKKPQ